MKLIFHEDTDRLASVACVSMLFACLICGYITTVSFSGITAGLIVSGYYSTIACVCVGMCYVCGRIRNPLCHCDTQTEFL